MPDLPTQPPCSSSCLLRWLRRLAIWGGASLATLLALVLVLLFSLPLTLPWLATHRVPGWLSDSGLPAIALSVEEAGWSKMVLRDIQLGPSLSIDRLSLSMNPLARGFGRLQISGLHLNAEQDADQHWSIPGLYPLNTAVSAAAPSWEAFALSLGPSFALTFELNDSVINLTFPQGQSTLTLQDLTLAGSLLDGLSGHITANSSTTLADQPQAPITATFDSDWSASDSQFILRNSIASLALGAGFSWQNIQVPNGAQWVMTANDATPTALTMYYPSSLLEVFGFASTEDQPAEPEFRIIPSLILLSPSVDIRLPSGNHLQSSYDGISIGGQLSLKDDGSLKQVALTGSLRDGTLAVGGLSVKSMESDLTQVDGLLSFTLAANILTLPGESLAAVSTSESRSIPQKPLRLRLQAHQQPADSPEEALSPLPPMAFTLGVTTAQGQDLLKAQGVHDVLHGKGSASVTIPTISFAENGLQPGDLHSALLGTITSVNGAISGKGSVSWTPGDLKPNILFTLKDVGLSRSFLTLSTINGTLRLTDFWPLRTPEHQQVTIASINAGLPLTDGTVSFAFDGKGNVVIEHATLTLARGALETGGVTLPIERMEGTIPLRVKSMSLKTLTTYSQLDGFTATGSVSGTLPLVLDDADILIVGGELTSDRPGKIRYQAPAGLGNIAGGNAGMELLLTALNDFHYKNLRLTVEGSAAGELAVGLHIAGANPELYDGYPVEFNLGVTGALSNLIASTVENSTVSDRISKRVEALIQSHKPAAKPKPKSSKPPATR